jgi:fructosamine-3-kinase
VNALPPAIRARLEAVLGVQPIAVVALSGGMINHAVRLETGDRRFFLKWCDNPPPGFFVEEAHGLELLRAAGMRVPIVLEAADNPSLLLLEWLEAEAPRDEGAFARQFAGALAAMHCRSECAHAGFGLDRDNYLGLSPQINTPHPDWPEFYRSRRLAPQIELARRRGRLTGDSLRGVLALVKRLEELLDGAWARPCLVHGDLWSGNFIGTRQGAALIDPAVYYGPREVELAYVELFGGFPARLVEFYDEAFPLDAGYRHRRPLHQLYPLLVHLNHFGQGYLPDVEAVCRFYDRAN